VLNTLCLINKCSALDPLFTCDRWWTCRPFLYVTVHRFQLSLAIPQWLAAVSIGESWGVKRHTA